MQIQRITYNILPNGIMKYLLPSISIIFHLHLFVNIFCDKQNNTSSHILSPNYATNMININMKE
jgi:hypothetical protein